jgi:hypothetical protein
MVVPDRWQPPTNTGGLVFESGVTDSSRPPSCRHTILALLIRVDALKCFIGYQ